MKEGETFSMYMPFELGLDMGRRRAPDPETDDKKFIIFEREQYELKRCLSDLSGVDVDHHRNDYRIAIRKLRNFLLVEAGCPMPGPSALEGEYYTWQAWMTEKKIFEGHSEDEAKEIPTRERLEEMAIWMQFGRPVLFVPD